MSQTKCIVHQFFYFKLKKLLKTTFDMNQFQQLSENYTEPGCELIDQLCSEISFMSSIIDAAKS